MAQGKKYNDDVKERAFALLACNNSVAYVAKELKLPYSTVKTWEKKFLAQSKELARQERERTENGSESDEVTKPNNELDLVKLRNDKKREFVDNAWSLIEKCETLIERRLSRAVDCENAIDSLFDEITKETREELNETQRKILFAKLAAIKIENVKELAVILGTLYDKQALANKEATAIIDNNVTIKFEDL